MVRYPNPGMHHATSQNLNILHLTHFAFLPSARHSRRPSDTQNPAKRAA